MSDSSSLFAKQTTNGDYSSQFCSVMSRRGWESEGWFEKSVSGKALAAGEDMGIFPAETRG
jgi:hypothetical protein